MGLPELRGHAGPKKGGHEGPKKGGHEGPKKGGHVGPKKGGHVGPKKGGHVGPKKGGHAGPKKGGHIGPKKGGHAGPPLRKSCKFFVYSVITNPVFERWQRLYVAKCAWTLLNGFVLMRDVFMQEKNCRTTPKSIVVDQSGCKIMIIPNPVRIS